MSQTIEDYFERLQNATRPLRAEFMNKADEIGALAGMEVNRTEYFRESFFFHTIKSIAVEHFYAHEPIKVALQAVFDHLKQDAHKRLHVAAYNVIKREVSREFKSYKTFYEDVEFRANALEPNPPPLQRIRLQVNTSHKNLYDIMANYPVTDVEGYSRYLDDIEEQIVDLIAVRTKLRENNQRAAAYMADQKSKRLSEAQLLLSQKDSRRNWPLALLLALLAIITTVIATITFLEATGLTDFIKINPAVSGTNNSELS